MSDGPDELHIGGWLQAFRHMAWTAEKEVARLVLKARGREAKRLHRTRIFREPHRIVPSVPKDHGPLVSVVIPSFNYGAYLPETVASVLEQTFRDLELLIVDGGSTDGTTPDIVRSFEGERVRVFVRNGRHGTGSNRNFGIERARGRYVVCIDSDDRLDLTYIEKAVFLAETCGFDIVGSSVRLFGADEGTWRVGQRVDLQRLVRRRNPISTHALFRRSLWREAGGYKDHGDGSAESYVYEDWEFWARMAAAGARIHNMREEHGLHHRVHRKSLGRRQGVRTYEEHAADIVRLNADKITSRAMRRSRALRRTPLRTRDPLMNIVEPGPPDLRSIVVAMPTLQVGGTERLMSTVLKGLASRGWTIAIVTTRPPLKGAVDTKEWFEPATASIFDLTRFLPNMDLWVPFLDYLVASRRASRLLIVGSTFVFDHAADLKAAHPQLQLSTALFNPESHAERYRANADKIDTVIVETEEMATWLQRDEKRPREAIRVVESGIDVDRYERPGASALRQRIGASSDEIVVGFSGRFSREKNPLAFVAVAKSLEDVSGLRFVMTGAGHLEPKVRAAVEAAAFPPGRFHLEGVVDDMVDTLGAYDVLVLPSELDGRPLVVMEAMACSVAVLAFEVGGVPELVVNGRTGRLCEAGNVGLLSATLREMVADRDALEKMRREARAFARANFNRARMEDRYEAALLS